MKVERIYHTWEKWECYPAGFYEDRMPLGMTQQDGEEKYREFLSDLDAFETALQSVITEWKYSCEHYLSNENMNRIAWLGQASMAYAHGIPAMCRGGFNRLTKEQQSAANELALRYLNKWMEMYGEPELTWETAKSKTQMDLY
jgi:murein L,D-transpeptidase YcbB/YkuD